MTHTKSKKNAAGFTLIELMVVIAIMVILASAMVINLAGQRAARDVKIAQNQLVSNLRKIQSYTLSSRILSAGTPAQYYIMKFDTAKPNQYTIQAMYNVNSSPQYVQDVETVLLPNNIILAAVNTSVNPGVYPVSISRANAPTIQNYTQTGLSCALVAFAAPFGKVFINDGCAPTSFTSPYSVTSTDDYEKILNFVSNTNCSGVYGQPFGCTVSTDSIMTITLTDTEKTVSKTVTVNGVTGAVIFN
jgi:prepilin-type N-terminal cleavage/methylation domain-containing protein